MFTCSVGRSIQGVGQGVAEGTGVLVGGEVGEGVTEITAVAVGGRGWKGVWLGRDVGPVSSVGRERVGRVSST